ncbi:hypothetical protein T439DRAFT_378026 [Meredithblackwellia eburnea MCA 4105]
MASSSAPPPARTSVDPKEFEHQWPLPGIAVVEEHRPKGKPGIDDDASRKPAGQEQDQQQAPQPEKQLKLKLKKPRTSDSSTASASSSSSMDPGVKRESRFPWSKQEDDRLLALVRARTGSGSHAYKWEEWAKNDFKGTRTPGGLQRRWNNKLKTDGLDVHLDPWTEEEDKLLLEVAKRKPGSVKRDWEVIAQNFSNRSATAVSGRWDEIGNTRKRPPSSVKGGWTKEEDDLLLELGKNRATGQGWWEIAQLIPGRSYSSVKQRHSTLTRNSEKSSKREAPPDPLDEGPPPQKKLAKEQPPPDENTLPEETTTEEVDHLALNPLALSYFNRDDSSGMDTSFESYDTSFSSTTSFVKEATPPVEDDDDDFQSFLPQEYANNSLRSDMTPPIVPNPPPPPPSQIEPRPPLEARQSAPAFVPTQFNKFTSAPPPLPMRGHSFNAFPQYQAYSMAPPPASHPPSYYIDRSHSASPHPRINLHNEHMHRHHQHHQHDPVVTSSATHLPPMSTFISPPVPTPPPHQFPSVFAPSSFVHAPVPKAFHSSFPHSLLDKQYAHHSPQQTPPPPPQSSGTSSSMSNDSLSGTNWRAALGPVRNGMNRMR